jgi:cytochrome d ubiquinol oxidase subunit I
VSDLLAARFQMALSLGFHIIFAIVGIGMPVLMVMAERNYNRTGNPVFLDLAKRWAKGTAILFAVGAVSGTILSFELGLLWPGFMEFAGPIIGMPFSLEGFAFFTEAIVLGIWLYGWDRISPRAHWWSGVLVAVSGAASAVFVVIANAWMNTPRGFRMENGAPVDVDPLAAMMTPAAFPQTLHMLLAAYAATGFAVAGIHAYLILRGRTHPFHRHALRIALFVGIPAALLQPVSGDISARYVARWQPAKLAALEGQFRTERGAPLRIGGWPDEEAMETRWAIEIPKALSVLAFHDPNAVVAGLEEWPRENWPPVAITHIAFQVMVGLGTCMAGLAAWSLLLMIRRRPLEGNRWLLRGLVVASPFGFIATEAGWIVTEVGRQPWIIYETVRTADAVTPMPGLQIPFAIFTLMYIGLAAIVVVLLRRHFSVSPRHEEPPA